MRRALSRAGGPEQLYPSDMLLISDPILSLCFTIKGTGYATKRPKRARTGG
jgi:hypothetical protein